MKNCILAGDMFDQVAVFKILGVTFDVAEAVHPIMTALGKLKKPSDDQQKLIKEVKA